MQWPNGKNKRACGFRKENGVYMEVGFGPGGAAAESFIIDPPLPLEFALSAQGVTPYQAADGVWHAVSHIGREYPHPTDFFHEYARLGVSWRVPANFPFDRLDPKRSRFLLTHPRGYIVPPDGLTHDAVLLDWACPRLIPQHAANFPGPHDMCAGMWYLTLPQDAHNTPGTADPQVVLRNIGDTRYVGTLTPKAPQLRFREAFCFRFGIGRFVVVAGEQAGARLARIERAGLPVELVDL
jgi:hypothetical protein